MNKEKKKTIKPMTVFFKFVACLGAFMMHSYMQERVICYSEREVGTKFYEHRIEVTKLCLFYQP